jgi:transcriptional regulator with AAA-type ATPase domain
MSVLATSSPCTPHLPLGNDLGEQEIPEHHEILECWNWLSFHRNWGQLADESLQAIAASLHLLTVEPGTEIYQRDQNAIGLYLLKWGTVELYRPSPVGKTHICYRGAGDLFGYVPLVEAAHPTYRAGAITVTKSAIWFLKQADFHHLLRIHADLQSLINGQLIEDLEHFTWRISWEQERIQGLQRYIHPIALHPTLRGQSKVAQKLAQQAEAATQDLNAVVLQGAVGTGKTFLAGYIHFRSGLVHSPFAELDCAQLPRDAAGVVDSEALFGNDAGQPGLIELLERGTLLIDNVHLLPGNDRDRLITYLKTGRLTRNRTAGQGTTTETPGVSWARLILASPQKQVFAGVQTHLIKLSTLLQRKDDIPEFSQYFLEQFCQEQNRPLLHLNQGDLRRLISYAYPGNLGELAEILHRAVLMTPLDQTIIPEQVLWSVESAKNAFRVDLLNQFPWLRQFLLSPWWPQRLWIGMMILFIPVTIVGFVGPQTREANLLLNFFWAWWWPGYLFFFAFVSRVWCAVCPFMITGEWLRTLSLWIWPRQLRPWPTQWLNRWGAWFLFLGFVLIYLWEHLWDLPHRAYLSAWLLLIITAGAVLGSLIYERRLWCRYLCPIGGMNGMFAKLSMVEVRSAQQVCGSQCQTFGCYQRSGSKTPSFQDGFMLDVLI